MEDGEIKLSKLEENQYFGIPLKVGVKLRVRDFLLKQIQNQQYITDNFKLNIIRLNRWWYSVYFDNKE